MTVNWDYYSIVVSAVNEYIRNLVAYLNHSEVNSLRPRQMDNILQIYFKLAFSNVNVDILIQMYCPSYLLFFYLVVNNNINQQGPTSNPVQHTWSKPQHKNITRCKTYQRKNNQLKELNRLLILSNFIDKKRKTIGKLVNGHIEHDISFQTKNPFN